MNNYTEKNNIITFKVTSNGKTGAEWIDRLKKKGFRVSDYAKSILISDDFKPTKGITTEVAVLKGMLFEDKNRLTKNIRTEAEKRKLQKPDAEIACLIREKFTDEELEKMGITWLVVMHEPIEDSDGDPILLVISRYGGGRHLDADCGSPGGWWGLESGFVFLVPQDSTYDLDPQPSLEPLSLDLYCECERCPHCKKLIK